MPSRARPARPASGADGGTADPPLVPTPQPERSVYCNRTVNLRGIRAIGYDMDYTLVHYRVEEWERAAFERARALLALRGWPVEDLTFDPAAFILGLVFDLDLGNVVKASRYGYVIRAQHGTRPLPFDEVRSTYQGAVVDLAEDRFEFMNTLFSLSQASLFAQLVDLADADHLPGPTGYRDVWRMLADVLEESHTEGELKAAIVADPERFVEPDPDLALTLADQHEAGKRLLLITNSDWAYTRAMMAWVLEPFLPAGTSWRSLFHLVIVDADKPRFFSERRPVYQVVDGAESPQPLLRRHRGPLEGGAVYAGGDAHLVEQSLGLAADELLYLGDHLFGDVHVTKAMRRWRTGLILRELEHEVRSQVEFQPAEAELTSLMADKVAADRELALLRLQRLRRRRGHGPAGRVRDLGSRLTAVARRSAELDAAVTPLAEAAGRVGNATWGPLMRAGSDRSFFARQVERHADLYTSRVSNLLVETPYAYLRAARTDLPHDL